jgi:hypothetical protein
LNQYQQEYRTGLFFSACDKNCTTPHNKILNRGFPEFLLFKIIDYIPCITNLQKPRGFAIKLNQKEVTKNDICQAFREKGLANHYSYIKITDQINHLFVDCCGPVTYNKRGKLAYNDQPYICESSSKGNRILIYDPKANEYKTGFTFGKDECVLDYYYVGRWFFVTLIDEHVKKNASSNELEHDPSFPEPQDHRLQIYDIESKELLHTQKLPLPEEYSFGNYNYLLDYADSTGYYLYHFPSKAIIHYIKTNSFDIKDEPATQQKVIQ